MIDSHAHLGVCDPPAAELVAEARRVGVGRILTIGLGEESNREAVRLAHEHPEVFAAVGRHPNSAEGFDGDAVAAIEELAADDAVRAIGETGLDFYRDRASEEAQVHAFEAQIGIARRSELPLVIHLRDSAGPGAGRAVADAFELLVAEADGIDVILHCFSATPERAEEAADRGWHVSFAGNVTYPGSDGLRAAAALVPDGLLLVETDSPFLAPQPARGRPNSPANVTHTAEVVAAARGIGYERLDAIVTENAARLFGWSG
ncbi:MAG TPA: TatD family hydrolase [Solirubrobacterales bacterium]|nr:TatD family hydrolase [Solirubrobacterales bacterium]